MCNKASFCRASPFFVAAFSACYISTLIGSHALLLSDLPTPSFVLDMRAVRLRLSGPEAPKLLLKQENGEPLTLYPSLVSNEGSVVDEGNRDALPVLDLSSLPSVDKSSDAIGYLHTSVIRSRDDESEGEDQAFLAQLDLPPHLCAPASMLEQQTTQQPVAQLVLGLNNHHVGSYYWARSAGAGSAMEAPGIVYNGASLFWQDEAGPTACNSNDGKRSEWVNFLRKGDTVQLRPLRGDNAALCQFVRRRGEFIYGVSSEGRPLGSEPEVVCEYKCRD